MKFKHAKVIFNQIKTAQFCNEVKIAKKNKNTTINVII